MHACLCVLLTCNEFQSHLSWRRISNGNVYVLVNHGKNIALFQGCFQSGNCNQSFILYVQWVRGGVRYVMSKILNNSIPITLFCSVFPCSYMCRYHWFGCSRFLQDVSTLCVQKIRHLKYSKSRAEVSRHRKFLLHSVCVYQTAVCHILGDHDLNLHD